MSKTGSSGPMDAEQLWGDLEDVSAKAWKAARTGVAFERLKAEILRARAEEERLRSVVYAVQREIADVEV